MVYMYHSFLIHSSADGHLGCFHKHSISKYKALSTKVKRCPATYSPGLTVFFFFPSSSVIGVSFPSSLYALSQWVTILPFFFYLHLVSGAATQTKSSITKKTILPYPVIFGGLVRLNKTNILVLKSRTWKITDFRVFFRFLKLCVFTISHCGFGLWWVGNESRLIMSNFLWPHVLCSLWNFPA